MSTQCIDNMTFKLLFIICFSFITCPECFRLVNAATQDFCFHLYVPYF